MLITQLYEEGDLNPCDLRQQILSLPPLVLPHDITTRTSSSGGPTENRTRAPGFKVPCTNRYTMGPLRVFLRVTPNSVFQYRELNPGFQGENLIS